MDINKKQVPIPYENGARVYSIETFKKKNLNKGMYSATSLSGDYILVYAEKDVEYLLDAYDQGAFDIYAPYRSIEDEIFDDYEEAALNINRYPFVSIVRKLEENEIFDDFYHEGKVCKLHMNCWFNKVDARSKGAKVYFTIASNEYKKDVKFGYEFRNEEEKRIYMGGGNKNE